MSKPFSRQWNAVFLFYGRLYVPSAPHPQLSFTCLGVWEVPGAELFGLHGYLVFLREKVGRGGVVLHDVDNT